MKNRIRLTESDLNRIVKRVIKEQSADISSSRTPKISVDDFLKMDRDSLKGSTWGYIGEEDPGPAMFFKLQDGREFIVVFRRLR